jgi:hypothetical protein
MMVLLKRSVECSAKITMPALLGAFRAMDLLPPCGPPGLIFLDVRVVQIVNPKMGSGT